MPRCVAWPEETALTCAQDLYCSELAAYRNDVYHSGRCVLLGDAAWGVGMGTTSEALIGGYVLAGELLKHGDGNPQAAFTAYEAIMRPIANPGTVRACCPASMADLTADRSALLADAPARPLRTSGHSCPRANRRLRGADARPAVGSAPRGPSSSQAAALRAPAVRRVVRASALDLFAPDCPFALDRLYIYKNEPRYELQLH